MLLLGKDEEYYRQMGAVNTAREIANQTDVWRKMTKQLLEREKELSGYMDAVLAVKNLRIVFTGAGSSAFAGEIMQCLLVKECGICMECIHSTDIVGAADSVLVDRPTLLISYARSGESPESVAAVRYARKKISNLYNIIIVCDENSSLAKYGGGLDRTLVLAMPPEACDRGFAMTGSVSTMLLTTWCLFHYKELSTYTGYVAMLADSVEHELEGLAAKAEKVAFDDYKRLIWLGLGALKGLTKEAAIKTMELTHGYVNSYGDAPTGFRHGPKTMVNDETLTVHFLSNQDFAVNYDLDFAREMVFEKRGNRVAVIRQRSSANKVMGVDYDIVYDVPSEISSISEMGTVINCLIFAQLLAIKKSLTLGITTDNPCPGGEVNRVVQGVKIYGL